MPRQQRQVVDLPRPAHGDHRRQVVAARVEGVDVQVAGVEASRLASGRRRGWRANRWTGRRRRRPTPPSAIRRSTRCEPTNPAPPMTSTPPARSSVGVGAPAPRVSRRRGRGRRRTAHRRQSCRRRRPRCERAGCAGPPSRRRSTPPPWRRRRRGRRAGATEPVTTAPAPIDAPRPTTVSTTRRVADRPVAPASTAAHTSSRRPDTRSRLAWRYSSGRPASIQ